MKIKRGDIYIVDLGEGFGSEQGGIRPALVVRNNIKENKYYSYPTYCLYYKQSKYETPFTNSLYTS